MILMAALVAFGWAQEEKVGYLFIETDLPEAAVIIDADTIAIAETPALCTLSVGSHTLTVRKEYYDAKTTTIEIEPGLVLRRRVNFIEADEPSVEPGASLAVFRQKGHLTILTDFGSAAVFVDSVRMAEPAPVTISDLAAGPHRLRLQYQNLMLDTVVTVTPDSTVVVMARRAHLWPGEVVAGSSVGTAPVSMIMELPPCEYRRDTVGPDRDIAIRGVDPRIVLSFGDSTMELTHRQLAVEDKRWTYAGDLVEKHILDTTITYTLNVPTDMPLKVSVTLLVNDSRRFRDRKDIKPIGKSYRIDAGLNGGRLVKAHLKVERNGEMVFRYW